MPPEIIATLTAHGGAIAAGLVGIALTVMIFSAIRRRRTLDACLTRLNDLQAMVSAYGQSLIAMDAAISRLDRRITEFTERNLEIQSQFAFNRAFEEASRLVRDGGSVESLVSECGLSPAEAALMVRLHRTGADPERPPRARVVGTATKAANGVDRQSDPAPAGRQLDGGPADQPQGDIDLTSEEIRLREVLRAAQRA
ncbi:MAG: DUF2802 domain-containing protein [Pseudomonadales bacterium]